METLQFFEHSRLVGRGMLLVATTMFQPTY
jgi:hypothetical protein